MTDSGDLKPVSYCSRTLRGAELCHPTYLLEMAAVIYSILFFSQITDGSKIHIQTDARCLTYLKTVDSRRNNVLGRWSVILQQLDCTFSHIPGKKNFGADALSRFKYNEISPDPDILTHQEAQKVDKVTGKTIDPGPVKKILVLKNVSKLVDIPYHEFADKQKSDVYLSPIYEYALSQILPTEVDLATHIVLTAEQFYLEDNIVYHIQRIRRGKARKELITQLCLPLI